MRLDQFLLKTKQVRSRTQATDLIKSGRVKILVDDEWKLILKPSFPCEEETQVKVDLSDEFSWVSRSGEKLHLALKRLSLDIKNFNVLDLGQSTGGFSECVLRAGASMVFGVDVGSDQLAEKIKTDSRVLFVENTDARDLGNVVELEDRQAFFDLLVMDVSFISSIKIISRALPFIKPQGLGLVLIKPQFEVGQGNIQKGGIVSSPEALLDCQKAVFSSINELKNLTVMDYFPSSLRGKDGNQEFFCFFRLS